VDGGREVVITGRDAGKLRAAWTSWARPPQVDARDQEATWAFFAGLGPSDHTVITATGTRAVGPLADIEPTELKQATEVKLLAHTITAQAALEVLREDGSLTFVTVASASAAMPGNRRAGHRQRGRAGDGAGPRDRAETVAGQRRFAA
jgi:NADP-dependent 3-hydroxy acid dehydrogenase YdfG